MSGRDQPVPISSARVYGASLIGAGLGCIIAIGTLPLLGGVTVVGIASLLGLLAAIAFSALAGPPSRRTLMSLTSITTIGVLAATAGYGGLDPRLSPYKDLSAALRYPDAVVINTTWESSARVDHVVSEGIRSVPGLSFTWAGTPPPQDGITFDGDDLSPVPLVGTGEAEFSSHVINSIAFSLHKGGDVLVLNPRGGLDVLIALTAGATTVTAVEAHGPAVEAARRAGAPAYIDPRTEILVEEPRSFVERTGRSFDVVDLALGAPYRPVTSGAYSLAEDYLLTAEAFDGYLSLLSSGGVLSIMRWLQTPPSESIRLLGLAAGAVRRSGGEPEEALIVLRGYATGLVMVKPDGFSKEEVESVSRFAARERFDIIAGPGLDSTNDYNVLPVDQYSQLAAQVLAEPDELYRSYEFDIAPPRDNRPFFTHFFKWEQASAILDTMGHTWQPFGGAGFFVLLALLAFSVIGATVLILGPLLVMTQRRGRGGNPRIRLWTVAYFGLLGLAFLLVELPLVQQYILLVGRPTTALAVVLFAILLAAGVGSMLSPRVAWRPAAVSLAIAAAVYPPFVGWVTATALPWPAGVRMTVGAIALAPLGFLMGVMFPKGVARLERDAPHLVPWAWGINGTTSVIAAATAALLTLTWGFQLVVTAGAACYAAAAVLAGDSRAETVTRRPG
jgi:hypothetical protein